MIDMMAAMMPYMRPFALAAAALTVLGLVLGLAGRGGRLPQLCGAIALAAGMFFVGCEVLGRLLGFEPTILFAAPADRVLYSNQWPFWTLGIGFLLAFLAVRTVRRGT